jgi:hypothetical protein
MHTSRSEMNLSNLIKSTKTKPIDIITPRTNIVTRIDYETSKSLDLNYSIYVDNPEIASSPDNMINKIYPKQNEKWVDSNLIHRCQICEYEFSFLNRKHHCRACGGVYCSSCCNKYIEIPQNLIKIPEQDINLKINIKNTLNWFSNNNNKQLVCNICDNKINNLKKVDYLIKIFEFLDLKTLYTMKLVCKNYNIAATYILSRYRDIQYGINNKSYNKWEQYILFISKEYLINHCVWFTNLMKCIIEYTNLTKNINQIIWLENILKLLLNNNSYRIKNINCFTLMCSRKCYNTLDFDDIYEILDYINHIVRKDETIIENIHIKNIIILLSRILFNKINKKIHTMIPLLCNFYNNLFDYETINLDNNFIGRLFEIIYANTYSIKKIITFICYEKYYYENNTNNKDTNIFFKHSIKYISDTYGTKILNDITKMMISINNIINDKITKLDFPFIYPLEPNYMIIQINNRTYFKSNTKPLLIEAVIKNSDDNSTKIIKFIIKKSNTLRKEQLISCIVDILQYKISDKYEEIPTYQIIMLSKEIGILEYIDNSITLRTINENGFTLQNYILNKNLHCKLDTIKTRFVQSLAISSAIAYIIGLGDRHLDNIMINTYGNIFHVDYGYIMENPTIIFNMPEIKVTDDIIDFLGGNNSLYYNEFKKLIVKIYNQLRANKNMLYIYFKFICESGFLDWNIVYNKLDSKLMTGMKCKDVEITLINEIESSNTYSGLIVDLCHSYKQKFF